MDFVDLQRQYAAYKVGIDRRLQFVLSSGSFILGPEVQELEDKLAAYVGKEHVITCASGTDALILALMSLGVGPGDYVVTTPFTFIATADTISLLGARPLFVDIDPRTYNMSPNEVAEVLEKRRDLRSKIKAIVAVSLFGQCADYDALQEIVKPYHIPVVEDGAQSFGATYKSRRSCSLTPLATTSFFPAKPFGCYGDGGAVFTHDREFADKIFSLRSHGQREKYKYDSLGINSRLDTLQAAILLEKLLHFDEEIKRRQDIARFYDEALKQKVPVPFVSPENTSVYSQYTIETDGREEFLLKLKKANIPFAVYYPSPLHLQKCYACLGYREGDFPSAEAASKRVVSLPIHPFLRHDEMQLVVDAVCS